jgi:hypothetical protein
MYNTFFANGEKGVAAFYAGFQDFPAREGFNFISNILCVISNFLKKMQVV